MEKTVEVIDKSLVFSPAHYNTPGKKECWDLMVDLFGAEATSVFCSMTAYKYFYRAGKKEGNPMMQDMAKMRVYLRKADELADTPYSTLILSMVEKEIGI